MYHSTPRRVTRDSQGRGDEETPGSLYMVFQVPPTPLILYIGICFSSQILHEIFIFLISSITSILRKLFDKY